MDCKHKLCEIVPGVYISSLIAAQNKQLLLETGITHIVNASQIPGKLTENFIYFNVDIEDDDEVDISRYFTKVSRFICSALVKQGRILVHCVEGISRSPTTACATIAFLVQKRKIPLLDAISLVKRARPIACPNEGFIEQLHDRFVKKNES